MTDAQIDASSRPGRLQPRMTLAAPIGGVVTELGVREGMTVAMGTPLFRINGLGTVWVNAEVPERAAARVRAGTPVEARTPALPGAVFKGTVERAAARGQRRRRARSRRASSSPIPAAQLKPGMFATVDFAPAGAPEMPSCRPRR